MSKNSESNEKKLLLGAAKPSALAGVAAAILFTVFHGKAGFIGSLLAQLVVVIYLVVHIGVSKVSVNLDPISTMAVALASYFIKFFALGFMLWFITAHTSRESIDRISFGISALVVTFTWLGGEIASYLKLKTHLPLPPQK
jgi:hypothetical protein